MKLPAAKPFLLFSCTSLVQNQPIASRSITQLPTGKGTIFFYPIPPLGTTPSTTMSKMLTYPLATAAVLLLLAGESSAKKTAAKPAAAAKKHPRAIRNDFLKAMGGHQNTKKRRQRKLNLKDFQDELKKDNDSARALRKKVFKKATFRTPAQRRLDEANDDAAGNDDAAEANDDANNNNNAQNNYNRYQYNNGNNGYNYNGNYNNQYQNGGQYYWEEDAQQYYQNYKQYNQQNNQGNYKYNQNKDGTDDGFAVFGDWENGFDFDPTQYSVSYYGCAEVKQYEDWVAADEDVDGVFATKHFAVFRFCPERTCMGWQEEDEEIECDEDYYGEDYCDYVAEYAQYYKQVEEYEKKWQQQYGNQVDENGDPVEYDEEAAKQYYYDAAMYDEEDINQYGARGEGCEANYGEYMILMQDYLEIMLEWQEERYNTYLNYCEDCMYKVYQQWLKNGGNRDRKLMTYDDFKASDEHRQLRKLSEDHRELGGYYGACPEYDTCSEYQKMGGMDDDYSDYFECTEVQRNNGQVAYIGPHCAEDKYTITLGLYGDQYCNEYIGNGVDISSFLQEEWDVEEDMLKKYYNSAYGSLEELKMINEENVCIPCNNEVSSWSSILVTSFSLFTCSNDLKLIFLLLLLLLRTSCGR